ncbi:hypothetical protein FEM48_Zijuj02G0109300 [Ziziphus jujuba var. spinosa]|uniref:UDP-glycosyltransferase 87A1-like n=1 Tax=Ziziphus jujuba var. spinosa TaxID=714518 RepID=A0A978VVB9_ZIZJJ|nr:hypothetical protein FEM48_Zijuj02G0109300 [Ziziphus jujuba var. spinosa]
MDSTGAQPTKVCHVVAMPYPGRGHINPMMNLCKVLVSKNKNILVTFVVTEEWLSLIGSEAKPDNIRFSSIPNVVPSERVRAANMTAFFDAVMSQMEAPFERLLDRLEPPPSVILADTYLLWAVGLGNRRNIRVSSFWPMSASMFSIFQHLGIVYIFVLNLFTFTFMFSFRINPQVLQHILDTFSRLPKAQCLTFPSTYELEHQIIDALRAEFSIPIYTIGPVIPYFQVEDKLSPSTHQADPLNYIEWLDCQPPNSVLYISFGSFMPVCIAQMDEMAAGLKKSEVRLVSHWFRFAKQEISKMPVIRVRDES